MTDMKLIMFKNTPLIFKSPESSSSGLDGKIRDILKDPESFTNTRYWGNWSRRFILNIWYQVLPTGSTSIWAFRSERAEQGF
jgi:hypothetical protein